MVDVCPASAFCSEATRALNHIDIYLLHWRTRLRWVSANDLSLAQPSKALVVCRADGIQIQLHQIHA